MSSIEAVARLAEKAGLDVASYTQRLHDDYPFFVNELWRNRRLDQLAPLGEIEFDILDWVVNGPTRRGVLAPRGVGKALALDTPLPTPAGWTTMGEVRVGDRLFDENGKPCVVTRATDVMHDRPCYRVCFSDGTSIVADADHLWAVKDRWGHKPRELRVLSTQQMVKRVNLPTGRSQTERRYGIPVAKPIQCDDAALPIPPYALGVWLGDGHSGGGRLTVHDSDMPHFRRELADCGIVVGESPTRRPDAQCATWSIGVTGHARCPDTGQMTANDSMQSRLRRLSLLNNKHIPSAYLRSSASQRLALLQGIVDTDGYISDQAGRCEVTTTKSALRDGIMELARSLGFKPTCCSGRAKVNGRDVGPKYRIGFHAHSDTPPARMPRKVDRLRARSQKTICSTRTIVGIEPVASVPVRCIQVDSPNHLYLAGEGMVPTHNTTFGTATYTLWRLLRDADTKIIIVSKSLGAAKKVVKLIRDWIDAIAFLRHLKPARSARGDRVWRDNTDMFDVGPSRASKDPSVLALGIGGQLENCRANVVIGDDVETRTNTVTLEAREALDGAVKDFTSLLYPGGEILYFGTFWHEESVYLKLNERGYSFRTWPLLAPHADDRVIGLAPLIQRKLESGELRPGSDRGEFNGSIVFAHRHDQRYISERMAEGRTYFAMQQMLIADLGDSLRYPLRLSDLIVFPVQRDKAPISIAWGKSNGQGHSTRIDDVPSTGFGRDGFYAPIMFDEQWTPYSTTRGFIDPSGRGVDELALAIVSQLHGFLFIKLVVGMQGGTSPENLERVGRLLREHRAREVAIETNFGGDMLARLLYPVLRRLSIDPGGTDDAGDAYPDGWACAIVETHASIQKEVRIIDTLEPVMASHRLVMDPAVAADTELQRQITRITRQRNSLGRDDRIDALAGVVGQFRLDLEIDAHDAAERQREHWIDEQLDDYRRMAGQRTKQEKRWISHHRP